MTSNVVAEAKPESTYGVTEEVNPDWNNPVTDEEVKKVWLTYARNIGENNVRLASIMNNHVPVLKDGFLLKVSLKNKTQDNELLGEKTRIFAFIRQQLKNAKLNLETEIVANEQHTKKAFTAEEKAKLMAKKNPALLLLTKKFDLDVE